MAELVDALVSGTSILTGVQVRVLFRAQKADFGLFFFAKKITKIPQMLGVPYSIIKDLHRIFVFFRN
jgi:hypothetical protein